MDSLQHQQLTYGQPCDPERAAHLRVTAHLLEGLHWRRPVMLDALLAWAVSVEAHLLPPVSGEPLARIEIPIQRAECGRFHLCSGAQFAVEFTDPLVRHKTRQAPWHEMARLGNSKITRVDVSKGANKSYRVPYSYQWLADNEVAWWCIGDAERILALLSRVHFLGRFHGAGEGQLDIHGTPWSVVPVDDAWPGFPILRDGAPLRTLPVDLDGITRGTRSLSNLTYPYWDKTTQAVHAVP